MYIYIDSIDLQIEAQPVEFDEMSSEVLGESSGEIRKRVMRARDVQTARLADERGVHCNAQMGSKQLR